MGIGRTFRFTFSGAMLLLGSVLTSLGWQAAALAEAPPTGLQPFVAGQAIDKPLAAAEKSVHDALKKGGFDVVGQYRPLDNVAILSISNPDMLKNASATKRGGYGAALSVALEHDGGKTYVTYMNPRYVANGYRLDSDNAEVAKKLADILKKQKTFGAKPRKPSDLRDFQYTFGMETFSDPMDLGHFDSFRDADHKITSRLKDGKDGVSLVYRIAIPGQHEIVYGVRLNPGNKDANGIKLVQSIDTGMPHRYAFLPYEVVLRDRDAEALNLRFRMALFFPDLPMLGSDASFFKLRDAPGAIKKVLRKAVGGKIESSSGGSGSGTGFEQFNSF